MCLTLRGGQRRRASGGDIARTGPSIPLGRVRSNIGCSRITVRMEAEVKNDRSDVLVEMSHIRQGAVPRIFSIEASVLASIVNEASVLARLSIDRLHILGARAARNEAGNQDQQDAR